MAEPGAPIPLCVDLDGTLVCTDMLHESLLLLAKAEPLRLAALPAWAIGGKAALKQRVADRVEVDPAGLPYRADVLDLIRAAREEGRPVYLVTAASSRIARTIADHLGLFDDVLATDGGTNLSAEAKAAALVDRFGAGGFDYIGNHRHDLPVIARARRAWLVSRPGGLRRAAARVHSDPRFLDHPAGRAKAWVKAIRVHQWLKNLLIFVPLLAAHQVGDWALLVQAALAFLAFSLCASSVYLLNDLLDLGADRQHRRKRNRPFAAGTLPLAGGIAVIPLLLAAAFALALLLPVRFLAVLGFYYLLTNLYSFWLKRQVIVDVTMLAGLYTVRILAGGAATGIQPSFWLLGLSMFVFLSLAILKRYSEIRQMTPTETLAGRGYFAADLPVMLALGVSSGMVAVLIMAMYTQAGIVRTIYPSAEWLWLASPLMLYWMARLWMKAGRGEIDDDPVVFAARDWQSLMVAALMGCVFALARSGWSPL